jgi:hypothetical protein
MLLKVLKKKIFMIHDFGGVMVISLTSTLILEVNIIDKAIIVNY